MLAEEALDGGGLDFVADGRGGPVGVDVVNLFRPHPGVLERRLHHAKSSLAVFGRLGDVEGVAAHRVADHFGQNARVAALGDFEGFEDEDAGALADDEAVAVGVEGPAGALGLVVAG